MNKVNPLFFVRECCIFQRFKVDPLLLPYWAGVIILGERKLEVKNGPTQSRKAEEDKDQFKTAEIL